MKKRHCCVGLNKNIVQCRLLNKLYLMNFVSSLRKHGEMNLFIETCTAPS